MRRTCKRKPQQGGFFLLPNEIFTLGLRAGEIAVYAYLLFCEDRETHLCYRKRSAPGKDGENQTRPCVALCAVLRAGWGNDTSEAGSPPRWSCVSRL